MQSTAFTQQSHKQPSNRQTHSGHVSDILNPLATPELNLTSSQNDSLNISSYMSMCFCMCVLSVCVFVFLNPCPHRCVISPHLTGSADLDFKRKHRNINISLFLLVPNQCILSHAMTGIYWKIHYFIVTASMIEIHKNVHTCPCDSTPFLTGSVYNIREM